MLEHAALNGRPYDSLTVYFDGSCPLCRAEISFFRMRVAGDAVAWVDVSSDVVSSCALGGDLDCRRAMERFHVRETDGELRSGAGAFFSMWKRVPRLRWAGRLLDRQPLLFLADRAYDGFLVVRPWLQRSARKRSEATLS